MKWNKELFLRFYYVSVQVRANHYFDIQKDDKNQYQSAFL